MSCAITDYLYFFDANLAPQALANQQIWAIPGADYYRIKVGGAFRIVNVNPEQVSPPLRYGVVTTTDAAGLFSLTLPYGDSSETHPASPEPKWSLLLPDGRVLTGIVPAVAGPLTLDDLLSTYGWVISSAVYVAQNAQGALARGTAMFTASSSATVLFTFPFAAATYVVKLTPSLDTNTNDLPVVGYTNKTTTGFEIKLSDAFTGTVDWEAAL